jgi:hypothetical protein
MLAQHAFLSNLRRLIYFVLALSGLVLCLIGWIAAASFLVGALAIVLGQMAFFAVAFRGARLPWLGAPVARMIAAFGAKVLTIGGFVGLVLKAGSDTASLAWLGFEVQAVFFIGGFIASVLTTTVLNARSIATVTD